MLNNTANWLVAWCSGRTLVVDRRTFSVLVSATLVWGGAIWWTLTR